MVCSTSFISSRAGDLSVDAMHKMIISKSTLNWSGVRLRLIIEDLTFFRHRFLRGPDEQVIDSPNLKRLLLGESIIEGLRTDKEGKILDGRRSEVSVGISIHCNNLHLAFPAENADAHVLSVTLQRQVHNSLSYLKVADP